MTAVWTLILIVNGTPIITFANFDTRENCYKAVEIIQHMNKENQLSVSCVMTEVSVTG